MSKASFKQTEYALNHKLSLLLSYKALLDIQTKVQTEAVKMTMMQLYLANFKTLKQNKSILLTSIHD